MARERILTLSWDHDFGEGAVNFKGMEKLYGIEQIDFLNDVIALLEEYRANLGEAWTEDYTQG